MATSYWLPFAMRSAICVCVLCAAQWPYKDKIFFFFFFRFLPFHFTTKYSKSVVRYVDAKWNLVSEKDERAMCRTRDQQGQRIDKVKYKKKARWTIYVRCRWRWIFPVRRVPINSINVLSCRRQIEWPRTGSKEMKSNTLIYSCRSADSINSFSIVRGACFEWCG